MNLLIIRLLQVASSLGGIAATWIFFGWKPAALVVSAALIASWLDSVGDQLEKKQS